METQGAVAVLEPRGPSFSRRAFSFSVPIGRWLATCVWLLGTLLLMSVTTARAQEPHRPERRPAPVDGSSEGSSEAATETESSRLEKARSYLLHAMPVSASRLLARDLSSGELAGEEAVLLGARAYAAFRAWPAVRRLLGGQPWLNGRDGGPGRLLLARAYLELDSLSRATALYEAELAPTAYGDVSVGTDPPAPEHRVFYARALAASGRSAEAVVEYGTAAARLPEISHWLKLSALQALASDESPDADSLVAELTTALADQSVIPSDSVQLLYALILFRSGDLERGVELARTAGRAVYAALAGEWIGPWLLARGDTVAAVGAFERALDRGGVGPEVGPRLLELDPGLDALLAVAESDLSSGRRGRGKAYLREALEHAPEDRRPGLALRLATAHRSDGEFTRAIATLGPWLERADLPASHRAAIWLLAGRIFQPMGQARAAADAFSRASQANHGNSSAYASFLLADLRHDQGDLAAARDAYRSTLTRFPGSNYGGLALIRLGLLELAQEDHEGAAGRFAEYRRRFRAGRWYQGAIYWSARAREEAGDSAVARALYRETIGHDPLGYYALLAGSRIGVDPWENLHLRDESRPALGSADLSLVDRMETLRALGWSGRARVELRASGAAESRDADRLLALSLTLAESGWSSDGVSLGWRARSRRERWSEPLLRAVYPFPYREALEEAAEARGLDPAVVAGLVRRESMFDAEIVSSASAVGLMQLLPRTAQDVARRAGLPDYRSDQLTVAEVNLVLGTRYLADMLDRFGGSSEAALIAYNAGPHRWLLWRGFLEREPDRELLVERIPFRETRDYVKAIRQLTHLYGRLYGLRGEPEGGPGPPDNGRSVPVDESERPG